MRPGDRGLPKVEAEARVGVSINSIGPRTRARALREQIVAVSLQCLNPAAARGFAR